jgi:hypothetical protein
MTSYDYIGASILHNSPPPHGYIVDVVEKDDEPGLVYLRLYADDVLSKPEHKAQALADWLNRILRQLNESLSIGKYTYEMVDEPCG